MSEYTKGKWTADDMGEYVFAHGYNMRRLRHDTQRNCSK